jgi:hypothetical protein
MAHEPKRHPAREHHHLGGPADISDASLAARSLRGKPVVRRRDHAGGPTGGPVPGGWPCDLEGVCSARYSLSRA